MTYYLQTGEQWNIDDLRSYAWEIDRTFSYNFKNDAEYFFRIEAPLIGEKFFVLNDLAAVDFDGDGVPDAAFEETYTASMALFQVHTTFIGGEQYYELRGNSFGSSYIDNQLQKRFPDLYIATSSQELTVGPGDNIDSALNEFYLVVWAGSAETEEFVWNFANPGRAVIVRGENPEGTRDREWGYDWLDTISFGDEPPEDPTPEDPDAEDPDAEDPDGNEAEAVSAAERALLEHRKALNAVEGVEDQIAHLRDKIADAENFRTADTINLVLQQAGTTAILIADILSRGGISKATGTLKALQGVSDIATLAKLVSNSDGDVYQNLRDVLSLSLSASRLMFDPDYTGFGQDTAQFNQVLKNLKVLSSLNDFLQLGTEQQRFYDRLIDVNDSLAEAEAQIRFLEQHRQQLIDKVDNAAESLNGLSLQSLDPLPGPNAAQPALPNESIELGDIRVSSFADGALVLASSAATHALNAVSLSDGNNEIRLDLPTDAAQTTHIDGAGGMDVAVSPHAMRDLHVIVLSETDVVVFDGLQLYQLYDVERLQVSDGWLAFDTSGVAGQAYRLYQAAFDREPDHGGLGNWIRHLDGGSGDLFWVAGHFISSREFVETYGTPATVSNNDFITLLYANVLDRAPDDGGYAAWNANMSGGMSRAEVLVHFSESMENQINVFDRIVDGIWFV